MPARRMFLLILLLLIAASALHAQTFTASYTPQQILYKGAPGYQPADLNAIVGLAPGKPYTTADVDPGLQRLADTGLFADIHYTISNLALTFTLTPQPDKNMLPALYSNFVMFDPGQLTPLIHAKLPLFTGTIPSAGTLQQSVQNALVAILQDKGFTNAAVDSINAGTNAVAFSITNPPVQLRTVHVDNVSPAAQPKVAEIQQAFAGNDYERGSEAAVQQRLADSYRDLAFLDVAIDPPTRSAAVIEPTRIVVDISTAAHEGTQYHVSKLDYPVSPIVAPADFEKVASLKPGDLAARVMMLSTGAHFANLFKRRGYIDAKVSIAQNKDSAAHTVAYAFTAIPGEQYHLKSVHTLNLSDQQQKDFDANWKLTPGSPYDEEYVASFIRKNTAIRSFQGYSATYKQAAYPDTHDVDLTITFVKGGVLLK
jgi:outer membrane protein assembly factor BamA